MLLAGDRGAQRVARHPDGHRRCGRSGATLEPSAFALSQLGGVILAPGLGAQGAGPADVARRFAGCRPGSVVPSSSRGLLGHGPDPDDLRRAARSLARELAALMG